MLWEDQMFMSQKLKNMEWIHINKWNINRWNKYFYIIWFGKILWYTTKWGSFDIYGGKNWDNGLSA